MRHMRNPSWNKLALGIALSVLAFITQAQDGMPVAPAAPAVASVAGADALADALTCRIGNARYPGLMEEIRSERPQDFRQTYRQYSTPIMDLYQLDEPVQAWGNDSDAIVIAEQRVMMAVRGSLEEITKQLEQSLADSSELPLSGALDDQHALVIFKADQRGLEGMVLLGCEYRIPGLSLLDDPRDAWRKPRATPAPVPVPVPKP